MPQGKVAIVFQRAAVKPVAVGQQHGVLRLVAFDPHRENREIVGPVEEPGDMAKAFRLALGAEHTGRLIQAFQRRVGSGCDLRHRFQHKMIRHIGDGQAFVI